MKICLPGFFAEAPVSWFLMFAILIVSMLGFSKKRLFIKLILHPYSIFHYRQFYRILSSDLVHNDIVHLGMNEFMLYLIAVNLEEFLNKMSPYGSVQFCIIYFSSTLFGGLVNTFLHRNDYEFSSAGASGGILGCMMSFMVLRPDYIALFLPLIGGVKNLYTGLFVIAVLIFYQRKSKNQYMNNQLHFYCALGGLGATLLLFPKIL